MSALGLALAVLHERKRAASYETAPSPFQLPFRSQGFIDALLTSPSCSWICSQLGP